MGKFAKVFWILLLVSLIIIYISGILYLNLNFMVVDSNVTNQIQSYQLKKETLNNQKLDLVSVQEMLLSNLAVEKEVEKQKILQLELEQLSIEEDRQKQIEKQKLIDLENAKLAELKRQEDLKKQAELKRQEEIRLKSRLSNIKKTRAS